MYEVQAMPLLTRSSETSIEIRFPSSGLTKLNYTSHFPAPPLATTSEDFYRMHSDFGLDLESTSPARIYSEFEEGWYYYLADIAARRLLQRVISTLYDTGESAWREGSFQSLLQTAEELERQLLEWYVERGQFSDCHGPSLINLAGIARYRK